MTDNDIIKALKCCKPFDDCISCLFYDTENCNIELLKASLGLINRLQAKNKEFDEKIVMQMGLIEWQKAEIARLKAEIDEANKADREAELQTLRENKENAKVQLKAIEHAKSEAIKEFAEMVKDKFCLPYDYSGGYINGSIDNLVKEMTEG